MDPEPEKYTVVMRYRQTMGEGTWNWDAGGWSWYKADLGDNLNVTLNLTAPGEDGKCLNPNEHEWGTYTYDLLVMKYKGSQPAWVQGDAIDWNLLKRYRDGYHLWVPPNLPSPHGDKPGHDLWTEVPEEEDAQLRGYYALESNWTPAQEAQVLRGMDAEIVVLDPELNERSHPSLRRPIASRALERMRTMLMRSVALVSLIGVFSALLVIAASIHVGQSGTVEDRGGISPTVTEDNSPAISCGHPNAFSSGVVSLPTGVVPHNTALVEDADAVRVLCLAAPGRSEPDWPALHLYEAAFDATGTETATFRTRLPPGFGAGDQWPFDFAAVRSAERTAIMHSYLGSGGVWTRIVQMNSDRWEAEVATNLSIPGYGVDQGRLSSVAYFAVQLSLRQIEGRVWLALTDLRDAKVQVTYSGWSQWEEWAQSQVVGTGSYPTVTGDAEHGIFLAFTDASPRYGETGAVLLAHSRDGSRWSEPVETVDDKEITSSALTFHPRHGLVLAYSAKRDDSHPLFVSRSADGGETWGTPMILSQPTAITMRPDCLLRDGRLYVAYIEQIEDGRRISTIVVDPDQIPVSQAE